MSEEIRSSDRNSEITRLIKLSEENRQIDQKNTYTSITGLFAWCYPIITGIGLTVGGYVSNSLSDDTTVKIIGDISKYSGIGIIVVGCVCGPVAACLIVLGNSKKRKKLDGV